MSFFTKFSLKNPIAVIILLMLVVAGGIFAATELNQELMPDMNPPAVWFTVVYPGATAQEMNQSVVGSLESSINNIEGVKETYSSISNGMTFMNVVFDMNQNLDEKTAEVEEAIKSVTLPEGVQPIKVHKNSMSTQPVLFGSVNAKEGTSKEEFENQLTEEIIPALKGLPGVSNVQVDGIGEPVITIDVKTDDLEKHGLTYQHIQHVLQGQNINAPVGQVTFNNIAQSVEIVGTFKSIEDIKNLLLSPQPEVRLSDVADIKLDEASNLVALTSGNPAATLNVFKSQDANTVDVSKRVHEEIAKFDDKVELSILFDSANEIEKSVESMVREGALGAAFASILILLFLRNIRATIISVISIPVSILITLVLLKQFDIALNIMTLGGMAVATGRVVDDSIVVIENIIRRMQGKKLSQELIIDSVKEVIQAITSSTVTTVAVFAPLAMVGGIISKAFAPFALTVVFSLLASLLVSITVVPMLAFMMMRNSKPKEHKDFILARGYKKALKWSLNHKAIVLILSIILFAASLPLASIAGFAFMPQGEEKMANIMLTMPEGTELKDVEAYARSVDEKLLNDERVTSTQLTIGAAEGFWITSTNEATWFVFLKDDADAQQFVDDMREEIKPADENITMEIMKFDVISGGSSNDIAINVYGPDEASIKKGAEMITETVKGIENTENVKNNIESNSKVLELSIRHDDVMKAGLTTFQARQMLAPLMNVQQVGVLGEGDNKNKIMMQLDNGMSSVSDLKQTELDTPIGTKVKVEDIADVQEVLRSGTMRLLNGEQYATVTGTISTVDKSKVLEKVNGTINKLKLPKDVTLEKGGVDEEINNMMKDMSMAMAIAVGLVYIVMVIAFGEGKAPFAILFSIPFAVIGSLIAAVVTKQPISLASMIGMLMLIGIVVTNAIVLLDRVKQQMNKGMTIRESVIEAGGVRLRPILMTAIATMCAIFPLSLGLGQSILISKGLAVTVIGGLTTSTILTLFIVPVMFEVLHRKRVKKELKADLDLNQEGVKEAV